MPNRQVKCPHCNTSLPRGEAVRHTNKRYYHKECYKVATKESRHYKELIEYICKIYNLEKPTGQIVKQIKMYKEDPELNYTYKGMELTLKYFYEILDNKPREGDGVGIIPRVYEKATEQYINKLEVTKSLQDLEEEKIIHVYINDIEKDKSKDKIIDIDNL